MSARITLRCGSCSLSLRLELKHYPHLPPYRRQTLHHGIGKRARRRQRVSSPIWPSPEQTLRAVPQAKTSDTLPDRRHHISSSRTPNSVQQSPQSRSSATRSLPLSERAAHSPIPSRKASRNRDSHHPTAHMVASESPTTSRRALSSEPHPARRLSVGRAAYTCHPRDPRSETAGCCTRQDKGVINQYLRTNGTAWGGWRRHRVVLLPSMRYPVQPTDGGCHSCPFCSFAPSRGACPHGGSLPPAP